MIKAENLHKSYGGIEVLKGVDLEVARGEVISIVGPSGAGKSTLLHIIGTLDKPNKGKVHIGGTDISLLNDKNISAFRNKNIGFVFQFHHLLAEFTALENVAIPALIAGESRKNAEQRSKELLQFLNLGERLTHKPSQLSGGEQQRIAVARALVNQPLMVLADEPSGNLDTAHAKELHELFFRLRDQFSQTFVIVTHNESLALMADRKLMMKDGRIISDDRQNR